MLGCKKRNPTYAAVDWQYSSIHRYIHQGILTADGVAYCAINIPDATGYE